MSLRVLKIILPQACAEDATALLKDQENLNFWTEESSGDHFVASALINSERSESLMDLFEKKFSSYENFRLILFPAEGSIPRINPEEKPTPPESVFTQKDREETRLRISREELYTDIVDSTRLSTVFIFMAVLSTIVAAIGLMKNNVAVIIGAMVIAPFLGPNVALSLSTNLADKDLGLNSFKTLITGIGIVLLLSIILGFLFKPAPDIPEIASRTQADLFDVILALSSGCAGVFAFTTGASSAVIGVMVAVALLPPLSVCGLLAGSGFFPASGAAFLLFTTNIICINLAGVATFLFQGVSPRIWWEADKAKKATQRSLLIWTLLLIILSISITLW